MSRSAVLAVAAPANDRVILRPLDLDAGLARSDVDYLYISSSPPLAGVRGEELRYQIEVRSRAGGARTKLEHGPAGMAVDAAGLLTWQVPRSESGQSVRVIVSVKDSKGQERLHNFDLALQ